MAKVSPDSLLEKLALSPAQGAEQEQELLQALLAKYADHRGVGQDAKWAVILREFNVRVSDGAQKTEASLKRAAKKITEQAKLVEDTLEKFSKNPAQGAEEENEVLGALLQKYAEHRGTGEDAKWTVITREFNTRASESSQKSEASVKRMAKKLSEKPPEKPQEKQGNGGVHTPEKVVKKKEPKGEAKAKDDAQAEAEANSLLRRDGYVFENASGESLSVRYFSRSAEDYDGPMGTLAADAKISLEFLLSGDLQSLLAAKEIEMTDTLMIRCFLFMMRMRLKSPDWRFDTQMVGACCDKWSKEGEWSEEAMARHSTVELHVWPSGADASAPAAKWAIKVCRCGKAEGDKLGWGAEFSAVAK